MPIPLRRARILTIFSDGAPLPFLPETLDALRGEDLWRATSSRAALVLFLEIEPDLVLLDLETPGIDAVNLIKQLKEWGESSPLIVAVAASHGSATRRAALAAGATEVACFPLDAEELNQRLASLLEDRLYFRELSMRNDELKRQALTLAAQLATTVEQLRLTQEQISKQERLRALGMMAGGVAHDFNNALTMMLGYSELLLPFVQSNAPTRERGYLQNVIAAAEDATHVVSRLKEFYHPVANQEIHAVEINEVARQAITLTAPRWNRGSLAEGVQIDIRMEFGEVQHVAGCAPELREALTNLIFNAVDAMPHGGLIRVATRRVEDRVAISVSDTGAGMSEETRRRCLEPFFTTKGDCGTGLGLALVLGIVQRHGGTIDITSDCTQGTTFTISLPCAEFAEVEKPEEIERVGRRLSVLVVDDQEVICELIGEHLRYDGHSVLTASHGRLGLELMERTGFDLVITDQSMPEMSGSQFAYLLKERWPGTPVILLTGFGEEMQSAGQIPEGVDLVLGKPVTAAHLRHAVFLALSRSGQHDVLEEDLVAAGYAG